MATNENVLGRVYETLLCSPGMNEAVKVDVKVNRKAVLLLSSVVTHALADRKADGQQLLGLVPEADAAELQEFTDECLKKAGLMDLSEKLKVLQAK
jgi:hypothetical protein